MGNIGVYKITNIINNKCYIGSSKTIKKRWYEHKRQLRKNQHHSKALQRAFNKYGEDNFAFEILELCAPDELLVIEQKYFDLINPDYIILKTAGRFDGYKHTEETKQIIREKRKNQISSPCSDETKKKIGEANKNRKFSDEHKEKLSNARIGKKLTEEHKNKIRSRSSSDEMRKKQKLSCEARKKNGNYNISENHKNKIIKANSVGLIGVDNNDNIVYNFSSHREAYETLGISEATLHRNLKKDKYKGLTWQKVSRL